MEFIRIENPKSGLGLFRHALLNVEEEHADGKLDEKFDKQFKKLLERHHGKFPCPYEDGDLDLWKDKKDWFCAFIDIPQVTKWIEKKEIMMLIKDWGFRIYKIQTEEFQQGNFQILYTKESITNQEDITHMFINKQK